MLLTRQTHCLCSFCNGAVRLFCLLCPDRQAFYCNVTGDVDSDDNDSNNNNNNSSNNNNNSNDDTNNININININITFQPMMS